MRNDRFVERKLVRVELLDRGIIPAFHFAEGGYHSTEVAKRTFDFQSGLPDKWIASGKNLTDFPWPDGANEREAMKLILCARPMLNTHVERWSKLVMKTLGRRGGENVVDVFVEEYLRELWERTRVARHAQRLRSSGS